MPREHTPCRTYERDRCTLSPFCQLESLNPGGSIKDRPALEILRRSIEEGQIGKDTVIVEATSGNMGIGLAQICCRLGLRFICITDKNISAQNLQLLRAYGAEVEVVTEADPANGDLLQTRIARAQEIARRLRNSFWVNQYANIYNARAHHQTMLEILDQLDGKLDFLFCAASSCGTVRGCAEYLRLNGFGSTKIYVADAYGSVIFGGKRGKRQIQGHGPGIEGRLFARGLVHKSIKVSDLECVIGCRRLLAAEALLVGGSSGATLMAVEHAKNDIPDDANCVMIFPDRGERYLETVFCDDWVAGQLGCSASDLESHKRSFGMSSGCVKAAANCKAAPLHDSASK